MVVDRVIEERRRIEALVDVRPDFTPFPKIARWNRPIVVTEKIDGTNAAVIVTESGDVWAQSRKRIITLDDDNFGFARWVAQNADELAQGLGPGVHFGEWWGGGIQRGYGLGDEKRFSLFNVSRWRDPDARPGCCHVVPVLAELERPVSSVLNNLLEVLRAVGSIAAPGFKPPEGIVIYHRQANTLFKVTLEGDDAGKGHGA